MESLKYNIKYDESISRWWITDMAAESFESPYETFDAEVNLGEAYVQIVYPVRKEFLKKNKIEEVPYYTGSYDRVYFPFENNRVDFTTFMHNPHHLWVNAKTNLYVPQGGKYPFDLYTCGGMKLWVNGENQVCFAPYTRNIPGIIRVELELKEGMNEIVVYADELAERDVFFYYEMRYKGDKPLVGIIELDQDVEEIKDTETFLKSCYFERDCITKGDFILKYDNTLLQKDKKLIIKGDEHAAKLSNVEIEDEHAVIAYKDKNEVNLGSIDQFNVGAFKVLVGCKVGEFVITRELVIGIVPEDFVDFEPKSTIEERKQQALEFICKHGENVVNRAMAILEVDHKFNQKALDCLNYSISMIENKEDCADFYLAPMFMMITRYRNYLTDEQYVRIKDSILNFRYWIDEPGNDVMWYFSENHALLFHISQYLGGYTYPEEIFSASGHTGKEQYAIGKKRVEAWFETFFKYGYAEWNSATYIPVDLIGFFVLYEMAPDSNMKELVTKAIDFTFKIMSYNTFHGIMSSSYGRAYEETLKVRGQVEPNFFQWVSYGDGYVSSASRAVTLYCLSNYEPPAFNDEVQLEENQWLSAELDQGMNRVKTYYYRTSDYFTACVRRFKPFLHGHQQHLMNVALGDRCVQYYINHPGERPFSGGNRPCYWAGNGTIPYIEQFKNIMVMIYKIDPDELVHYIHAYTPLYEYDNYELKGKWFFVQVGDAYMGTYFSNGVTITQSGANTNKEVISQGLNHGIIIKCGSKTEFGSFDNFKEKLSVMDIQYDGNKAISFEDPQYGAIELKDRNHFTANEVKLDYSFKPVIEVKKGNL